MNFWELAGLAIGLAMDATAVALGCSVSLRRVSPRQIFRFSFHFGLFQALMPLAGWIAGRSVRQYIDAWDHWIAFVLLVGIGGKTILTALRGDGAAAPQRDPTRGWSLVALSLATSIDAFAVGLSLALLGVDILPAVIVIGLVTAALVVLAMYAGGRLGAAFGRPMEILGGILLIAIGVRVLLFHL